MKEILKVKKMIKILIRKLIVFVLIFGILELTSVKGYTEEKVEEKQGIYKYMCFVDLDGSGSINKPEEVAECKKAECKPKIKGEEIGRASCRERV